MWHRMSWGTRVRRSRRATYLWGKKRAVIFIRELLTDLNLMSVGPSLIYSDSKSAVDITYDPIAFKKTKHVLRAAEFLRDLVTRRVITFTHVMGTRMPADIFTKAVSRAVFLELLRLLGRLPTQADATIGE